MSIRDYGFLFDEPTEMMGEIRLSSETIPAGEWITVLMEKDLLKRQREALGLTQEQVAQKARIDIRQYQRFESGERSLTNSSFRMGLNVCNALGIDPMYFCKTR